MELFADMVLIHDYSPRIPTGGAEVASVAPSGSRQ